MLLQTHLVQLVPAMIFMHLCTFCQHLIKFCMLHHSMCGHSKMPPVGCLH